MTILVKDRTEDWFWRSVTASEPLGDGPLCVIIEPTGQSLTAEDAESLVGCEASATLPLRGKYPPLIVDRAWLTPSGCIYAELVAA